MPTIVGLVLGYQLWFSSQARTVRERQAAGVQLKLHGAFLVPGRAADRNDVHLINIKSGVRLARDGSPGDAPSWCRRLLGDQEILMIELPRLLIERESELLSLFPEADIVAWGQGVKSE